MTDYKDRVSGWATDIDWSKAPENAKGAIVTKTCNVHHPKIVFASGYHLTGCMIRATAAEDGSPMSAPTDCWDWVDRPAPQWSGDGLPPVGTECEVLNNDLSNAAWEKCTILFSGKHRIVYDSESCSERVGYRDCLQFRPIKTQAQIAAEEREAAVRELAGAIMGHAIGCRRPMSESGAERLADHLMMDGSPKPKETTNDHITSC